MASYIGQLSTDLGGRLSCSVGADDTTDSYFWYQVDQIKCVSIDKMTSDAYLIPYIQLNISFK